MDGSERAAFIVRWRGALLGVGVLGALTVAGAAILTVLLMIVGVTMLLTSVP